MWRWLERRWGCLGRGCWCRRTAWLRLTRLGCSRRRSWLSSIATRSLWRRMRVRIIRRRWLRLVRVWRGTFGLPRGLSRSFSTGAKKVRASLGWMVGILVRRCRGLLFVDEAGAAGLVYFQVDVDFDAVGDLDEGDAAVDTVVFAIEGHGALDGALAGPLAFDRQFEGLGLG